MEAELLSVWFARGLGCVLLARDQAERNKYILFLIIMEGANFRFLHKYLEGLWK